MTKISTGSYDLNKWLFGGYETDIASVIYGGSGTGKTNFCLLAAVSQAKKGNKVIFIDTLLRNQYKIWLGKYCRQPGLPKHPRGPMRYSTTGRIFAEK